jgi:hypothetical protein
MMVEISTVNDGAGHTIQIKMMGDHYAVLANGFVIGVVSRDPSGKTWGFYPLDGRGEFQYVPLQHALAEALKWRQ